jgi:hypothetical protein
MTIIPLAINNCSVVELLLQVFALVYASYGQQHCITSPKFLSIRNNVIPLQLLQMATKVMMHLDSCQLWYHRFTRYHSS